MQLDALNITDMGRWNPLASIRNETSGTEQGWIEGGMASPSSQGMCPQTALNVLGAKTPSAYSFFFCCAHSTFG